MTISQQEIIKRLDNFRQASHENHLPITPQKLEIFRIIASLRIWILQLANPLRLPIFNQVWPMPVRMSDHNPGWNLI